MPSNCDQCGKWPTLTCLTEEKNANAEFCSSKCKDAYEEDMAFCQAEFARRDNQDWLDSIDDRGHEGMEES